MTHFLLIGFSQETAYQLASFLSPANTLSDIASATELIARLNQETQRVDISTVLLLEVRQETHLIQQCETLKQNPITAQLPLLCVLTSPEQREIAFAAGATDYLIQPLVAPEVQARLSPYLHPPHHHNRSLLPALNQLDQDALSCPGSMTHWLIWRKRAWGMRPPSGYGMKHKNGSPNTTNLRL